LKMKNKSFFILVFMSLVAVSAVFAEIGTVSVHLSNAGFEIPALGEGQWFKHVYGWESAFSDYLNDRCPEVRNPATSAVPQSAEGKNYGWLNGIQLFQIPDVIKAGRVYKLSADIAKYGSLSGVYRILIGIYDPNRKYETSPIAISEATHLTNPLTSSWQRVTLEFDSSQYPQWVGYQLLVYIWANQCAVDNLCLTKTVEIQDVVYLTIEGPQGSEGNLDPAPGVYAFERGDEIKLTARRIENSGSVTVFDSWQGELEFPYQPETTVVMDENKTITAMYAPADSQPWDVKADTWVGRDALGRELPGYAECGPIRPDRKFISAYAFWLGTSPGMFHEPYDVTKILANPSKPWGPQYTFHFWGEPELGYYKSVDDYVMRKNILMLDAAGVDAMAFECTNAKTYPQSNMIMCEVMEELQNSGSRVPKMCFWSNPSYQVEQAVYLYFYSRGLYSDLWFYLDGKPLILPVGDWSGLNATLKNYFTFRQCWSQYDGQDRWQSNDYSPQDYAWHLNQFKPEETSVGAGRHATTNIGRSYHNGSQPPINEYHLTGTEHLGLFFEEQWNRALNIDANFIFLSTWNEWGSFRYIWPEPVWPGLDYFLGKHMVEGQTFFGDDYNQEYSRDIEPMKGGHTDNYYYQMVANIRRYKGVRPPETPGVPMNILIDGDFEQWKNVKPEYRDYKRDNLHRNEFGWGDFTRYINTTGRNDFVLSKVSFDAENIYFYVQTLHPISNYSDPNWMLLFIDSDQNSQTGWEGFDYLINAEVIDNSRTTIKTFADGQVWQDIDAEIAYALTGNEMEIKIPRQIFGQNNEIVAFDFHWADNIQKHFDIIEFSINGDSAPDRRLNYRFDSSLRDLACQMLVQSDNNIRMDIDGNCLIDIFDMELFGEQWLENYSFYDFAEFARDWNKDLTPDRITSIIYAQDDFETGQLNPAVWTSSGNAVWSITTDESQSGQYSCKSGVIENNQISILDLSVIVEKESVLNFNYRISSELNKDWLRFYINSSEKGAWSGQNPWMRKKYYLAPGQYTLRWTYIKSSTGKANSDCAWIDNISVSAFK